MLWSSPKSDKVTVKMPEFEDSDGNELVQSLNSEYGGLDVPIVITPGAKKSVTKTSEQPCWSTRENNIVNRFDYNDYMTYHSAFTMKVAIV